MFGLFNSQGSIPKNAPDPAVPHELVLYRSAFCGYCRRVEAVLPKLSIEVEQRDVAQNSAFRNELISTTGRSTVPCLFIDGQPMFESLDIIAWLKAHDEAQAS